MLEELRRTLPRYKKHEQELPMTKALEDGLSDMYTEIIIFCARAITFETIPVLGGVVMHGLNSTATFCELSLLYEIIHVVLMKKRI